MGAGKNKSHRKKRISKHVLDAQDRKKQEEIEKKLLSAAEGGGEPSASATSDVVAKNAKANQASSSDSKQEVTSSSSSKTKDPEEAASYLSLWNYDKTNNTKQWKFNKNTQSWLLRHMYDFDKVSKATFALLVEYLCQGGEGARSRVEEDAKWRARRYKEWEKKGQQQSSKEDGVDSESKDENTEEKTDKKKESTTTDGDKAWNVLDDHDKRKEYKRARKVLDSLKATRKSEEDDQ